MGRLNSNSRTPNKNPFGGENKENQAFGSRQNNTPNPFGGGSSSNNMFSNKTTGNNPFGGNTSSTTNPFQNNSSSNTFGGASHYSVSGRETQNEKQVQTVGENFMRVLDPASEQNKLHAYVFNKFGNTVPLEFKQQWKNQLNNMAYDEKYNKVRRMNPDEDEYYIYPVTSFSDIYERKKTLNEIIEKEVQKMKKHIEKMNQISGKNE